MLYTSIVLFALAAVAGLILISAIIGKRETPKAVVIIHGLLAATGLIILLLFAMDNAENKPKLALGFFVVAALGGFYLFYRDLKGKAGPVALAVLHAALAVTGFGILLFFAFG